MKINNQRLTDGTHDMSNELRQLSIFEIWELQRYEREKDMVEATHFHLGTLEITKDEIRWNTRHEQ